MNDNLPRHAAWLPYIVAATFFMEYLDTTIVATALPSMARDFRVGPNALSLGLTAYMLTLAVFIPVSGWIADRFGSRSVFATAIIVFTLSSLACAASNGVASFTASRFLQGLGGAMMVPVGRMIVVRNTEPTGMMRAISTITWPGIFAPVIGPSLGGFITSAASWHWVFLINLPVGAAALAAVLAWVPQQRAPARAPLDRIGFVLSAAGLSLLLYGTESAGREDASFAVAILLVLAGLAFGTAMIRHARRATHPLIDFTTLRVPTFVTCALWGSASRIGIDAVPYLLPLLFQIGFGLSAFQSGLLLLASAAGNLGMKTMTTPILRRFGFRTVALCNGTLVALCIAALAILTPGTSLPLMLAMLFAYGLCRSLQFTTLATFAYADIPGPQKGSASTLWSSVQQMVQGMGIAVAALCLRLSTFLRSAPPHHPFTPPDFHFAFLAAGLIALIPVIRYARLPSDAGDAIRSGSPIKSRS